MALGVAVVVVVAVVASSAGGSCCGVTSGSSWGGLAGGTLWLSLLLLLLLQPRLRSWVAGSRRGPRQAQVLSATGWHPSDQLRTGTD